MSSISQPWQIIAIYVVQYVYFVLVTIVQRLVKFDKKYLWGIIPLLLIGGLVYYFSDIVIYIVLAWALSMVGAPIVSFLKKYVGKNAAAGITVGLFVVASTLLVWMFIPPLLQQAKNLASVDYQKMIDGLEQPLDDWNSWLINRGLLEDNKLTDSLAIEPDLAQKEPFVTTQVISLDSLVKDSTQSLGNIAVVINIDNEAIYQETKSEQKDNADEGIFDIKKGLTKYFDPAIIPKVFSSFIGFFGNLLVAVMSILFIAFFFLREHGLFNNMLSSVIPNKYETRAILAIKESSDLLIRYFIGVLIQVTIITLFVSIALSLIGVKNALLIGFFAALMNIIPYIGPILGASFAILITLSSNIDIPFYDEMLPMLLKVLAVFGAMQLFDNFILQPNIFSRSVKAHPLEIFLIVLIGAKMGGVLGMVVAIPIYTVLRVLGKVFFSQFKIVQRLTAGI